MALLKNHTDRIILGISGFASVFMVWGIWGIILGWRQGIDGFPWTYWVGDHAILPLFNAIAFILVWRGRKSISWRTIAASLLVIPIVVGTLMARFEPNASWLWEHYSLTLTEIVSLWGLHLCFVFGEMCFVVFMIAVYPFLSRTWKPVLPVSFLYASIEGFLSLLFILDTPIVAFPLWIQALTTSLVAGAWIAFMVQYFRNRFYKRGGLLSARTIFDIRLVAKAQINILEEGAFSIRNFLFQHKLYLCELPINILLGVQIDLPAF